MRRKKPLLWQLVRISAPVLSMMHGCFLIEVSPLSHILSGHLGDIEVEFSRIKHLVEDPNGAVQVGVEQGAGPHTSLVLPEAVLAAEREVGRRPRLLDPRRVSDQVGI